MRSAVFVAPLVAGAFLASACGGGTPKVDTPRLSTPENESRPPPPRALVLERSKALSLLCTVLDERDLDCDRRVTVEDEKAACAAGGAACPGAGGRRPYVVRAENVEIPLLKLHQTAQLVQELVVGLRTNAPEVNLDLGRVRARPGAYLEHRIDAHFWDALTRRIDATPEHLLKAAADPKISAASAPEPDLCAGLAKRCTQKPAAAAPARAESPELFVYYPASDARARDAFRHASIPEKLSVAPLDKATNALLNVLTRTERHGLLTLALDAENKGRPFVVPGGRFNEMYGWDSYFIVWGLVHDPARVELARSMVDNLAYEITHYGKILNANRTYYLMRSQPPFLTSSIREVWSRLPQNEENRRWLAGVLAAAVREYRGVWSTLPRRGQVCDGEACLARYFAEGTGEPPEVEPGHFDDFYVRHAVAHGHCAAPKSANDDKRFRDCAFGIRDRYRQGTLHDPLIDEFFRNDACMRESGHDTTYRFQVNGEERCTDYATVDLNALLFKTETDLATLIHKEFAGTFGSETTKAFCRRAEARMRLVRRHLWDDAAKLFLDYDTRRGRRSDYVSATTLYPLWASAPNVCDLSLVTPEMAAALRTSALRELEAPGGLYATAPSSLARVVVPPLGTAGAGASSPPTPPERQWEAPNGWAPHQMLAWVGLRRHGFPADAERLAFRWLSMIVKNSAEYHGTVPEKFDVKNQSHRVFAEYGNVNTTFSYIADEGFGWMNASFVVGYGELDAEARAALGE
jgi:alpha,alpha-trehalase